MATTVSKQPFKRKLLPSKFSLYGILTVRKNSQDTGTKVRIPITAFQMTFTNGVTQLPTARVDIALGIATESRKASPIHDVMGSLNTYCVLDVYFSATGYKSQTTKWPAGAHLIWHGAVTATAYSQTATAFAYTIDSIHWVRDLDKGSLLSKDFTRANSLDLLTLASVATENGAAPIGPELLTQILTSVQVDESVGPDLWYKRILPGLTALMLPTSITNSTSGFTGSTIYDDTLKRLQSQNKAGLGASERYLKNVGINVSGGIYPGNTFAINAITGDKAAINPHASALISGNYVPSPFKFGTVADAAIATDTNGVDGKYMFNNSQETYISAFNNKPLAMDTHHSSVIESMTKAVSSMLGNQVGQSTALDKLAILSEEYIFSILPNVRTVAVAPMLQVFPSVRTWRVLRPYEFTTVSGPVTYAGSLAGIVVKGDTFTSITGTNDENVVDMGLLAGVFIGSDDGQLQMIQSPAWILNKRGEGQELTGTTSTVPGAGTMGSALVDEYLKAGSNYAHAHWVKHNFGLRMLIVTTPLRFDIGPGSNIALEGINLGETKLVKNKTDTVFGNVYSVTIQIDANNSTASTQLQLSHVRTASEEDLVPDGHPIYTYGDQWVGQPLVRMDKSDMIPELNNV